MSTSAYRTDFTLNDVNNPSWQATEETLVKAIIDRLPGIDRGQKTFTSTDTTAVTILDTNAAGRKFGYVEVLSTDDGVANDSEYSKTYFKYTATTGITQDFKIAAANAGVEHTVSVSGTNIQVAPSHAGTGNRIIKYGFYFFDPF